MRWFLSVVALSLLVAVPAAADSLPDEVLASATRVEALLADAVRGHRAAAEFGVAECVDDQRQSARGLARLMKERRRGLGEDLAGSNEQARASAARTVSVVVEQLGTIAATASACYEIRGDERRHGYVSVRRFERGDGVLLVAYPAQFDEPDSTGPPLLDRRPDWLDHYRAVVRRF